VGFLDPGKLLVILVVALIVLGPERLPRFARQAGAAWRELTRVRDQVTEEIRSALPDVDLSKIPRMPTNVVSGFIADLTRPSVSDVGGMASGSVTGGLENGAAAPLASDEAPGSLASSSGPLGAGEEAAGRPTSTGAVHSPAPEQFPLSLDDASMN
jgi:sec-independent protein translocase protein TatB